jgi:ubiquinone/menaquinone biosynthesis C-methylase UbiE
MSKKQSCDSTSYTGGFKITRQPDGMFVATKGDTQLKAKTAQELNEQITKFNKNQPATDNQEACSDVAPPQLNEYFFEIHSKIPREGPGDNTSTRRAYKMLKDLPEKPRLLDIGCGPGMQTIELAKISNAEITALDFHQPFLDEFAKNAEAKGVKGKIKIIQGDMCNLGFEPKSFDVIWCEGAIFIIGFEKGLREWRKFLSDKGYIAVTEMCWIDPNPPKEIKDYLTKMYPPIKTLKENLQIIKDAGYQIMGYFVLPDASWWENYYLPISAKLPGLKKKYQGNAEALASIAHEELQIEMFHKYSKHYGYVFYVMQAQ